MNLAWLQENLFALIATVIAVYGAALSTYKVLSDRRARGRQIRVRLVPALPAPAAGSPDWLVGIEAVNPGERPVMLDAPMILLPNSKQFVPWQVAHSGKFPCSLEPGCNLTARISVGNLTDELRRRGFSGQIRLRGQYRDALGSVYTSKPMLFDVDESAPPERPPASPVVNWDNVLPR